MIVLIDHDDSFIHTLASHLEILAACPVVISVREVTVESLLAFAPAGILLSPGPGSPMEWPVTIDIVRAAPEDLPILGVCLGHQCIAAAFGGAIVRAPAPRHGIASIIHHDGGGAFDGLPNPFSAARYHSLAVTPDALPPDLVITATADDGVVMGVRHRHRPVEGVQFHPESVLTTGGHALLANFVRATANR